MIQRHPLNGLQPRTARELERDAFDWWEGPATSAGHRFADLVCAVGLVAIVALLCFGVM
jgi:hypothetical protein